jgi:hypothetical protein
MQPSLKAGKGKEALEVGTPEACLKELSILLRTHSHICHYASQRGKNSSLLILSHRFNVVLRLRDAWV